MAPVLRQVYDQMTEPKWVISMGVCASTGGMFNNYAIVQGVDQIVPVDVYAPGCPPSPETLLHAILTLHEKIRTGEITRRPVRHPGGRAGDRRLGPGCTRRGAGGHAAVSEASPTAVPAAAPSSVLPEVPRLSDRLVDQLAFPHPTRTTPWWRRSATPGSSPAPTCARSTT